jgi:methionyl-tRNA formyltransferase
MTPRLDGGPILARVQTEIGPEETADQLEKRLSQMGIPCCFEAIEKLERCSTLDDCMAMGDLQDNSLATPAPRLAKADGQLDFRYSADVIDRQIRGLQPWPGTFGVIQFGSSKELRVIVGKARPLDCPSIRASQTDISLQSDLPPEESSPGEILWGAALRKILSDPVESYLSNSDRVPLLAVVCAEKLLEIMQIQPSGKKMLGAREFLAGYGKVERMRFLTPPVDSSRRLLEIVRNSCLEK